MRLHTILIWLGILVAVWPYLGFPSSFDTVFYTVAGLFVSLAIYFSSIQYCATCGARIGTGTTCINESCRHSVAKSKKTKKGVKSDAERNTAGDKKTERHSSDSVRSVSREEIVEDDDGVTLMK